MSKSKASSSTVLTGKLAYLCDIFSELMGHTLNLELQGNAKHLTEANDTLRAIRDKLNLWWQLVQNNECSPFPTLQTLKLDPVMWKDYVGSHLIRLIKEN